MQYARDHLVIPDGAESCDRHRQTIDREKVLAILRRRFPGATPEQIAAAANALVSLKQEQD
jgi:hypothetical protein